VDFIIHGFAVPRADGSIDATQGNFADYLASGLVAETHRRGKKILVSLGGAVGSQHFAGIAASPSLREQFARNLVELVRREGYDGVDVDYEFPEGPQQTREFTLLMQAVHQAVKANNPSHVVVFGASPGYFIDSYEWGLLGQYSDYALVFGYDWKNPANGPMTNPGVVQWTAQNHTIEASVRGALDFALGRGYPASKLVMGLPFYGSNNVSWSTVRNQWAAQASMTPHPQWMEVQLAGAWFTTPEAMRMKLAAVLNPQASVLAGGATLAGVGFWEFGHESPAQPDLSRAIGEWVAGR
jgi:GH18 family chitinase